MPCVCAALLNYTYTVSCSCELLTYDSRNSIQSKNISDKVIFKVNFHKWRMPMPIVGIGRSRKGTIIRIQ